jgi:GYF domain 2
VSDWWYVSNSERKGPVGDDDLHRLLVSGALTSSSLVWTQGMREWQPVAQIDQLASLLTSLPPEIPPGQNGSAGARRWVLHVGSSIAFLFGCLSVIAALSGLAQTVDNPQVAGAQKMNTLIGGVVMILGALAYRSAKKRRIGEAKSTLTRQFLEIASLVLICLVISCRRPRPVM